MKKHITALFFGALFVSMVIPHAASAAFGISPPFIHADHLVPGAKYVQSIYLVQDKPDQDLPIKAVLDIPERVRSWVKIEQGENFSIPKGVRQFAVTITIDVPKDADLGLYHGNITFTGAPTQDGQVKIALGAQVSIDMKIGNDVYEKFSVPLIRLLDIEEGWDPRVYVKFMNEGNVPEAFTSATYELLDQYGAVRLAYVQKNSGFPETPPFTTKEYTVEFPAGFHLGLGEYWGKVDFYQRDKLIASQKTVFRVLEKGSLSTPLERLGQLLASYWWAIAAALVFLVLIAWFGRRSRKR